MIPILFDNTETEFTSNGLGRLADCISCTVTEELNGIYECQFTYPVSGEMYPLIQEGCIIGVIHDDVHDVQPFDIYGRSAPLNGVVTFYSHHISYRLGNIVLKPMTASSCAAALAAIPNQTYTECPFTFWTNKSVTATWKNEVPSVVKAILGGQEGSILDVYGKGEYEWDKWTVKLYTNRGVDNGVSIRYGVNLTDIQQDIDTSASYTAVVPFWRSGDGAILVTLDEGYITIDDNDDTLLRTTTMDLSDAFQEEPTQAQLRTEAMRRLTNSEAWLPSENINVKFVDLAHTEEYKAVAALQRVRLCDRVSVYCGPLGVSAVSMQVVRVVFNALTERYDEIELGKAKISFAQVITAQVDELVKNVPSIDVMRQEISDATGRITGAMGGHVRFVYDANGDPQEILIMDTEDIETAVNVWRWNSGGLGFSSNGYAGPYEIAITADGKFVANFITVGELTANIIRSGVLDGNVVFAKLLNIVDDDNVVIASFKNIITIGRNGNARIRIGSNYLNFIDAFNSIYFSVRDGRNEEGLFEYTETLTAYTNEYNNDVVETKYKIAGTSVSSYYQNIKSITVNGVALDPEKLKNGGIWVYTIAGDIEYSQLRGKNPYTGTRYFSAGDVIDITYDSDVPKYYYNFGKRLANSNPGSYSIISGYGCDASGLFSIALGASCVSTYKYSYSRGNRNTANGYCSTAIGQLNEANGSESLVCGEGNIANGFRQFVFGRYNEASSGDEYVEIVGNGTKTSFQTNRSNARTLDWNGNEWIAGALSVGNVSKTMENLGASASFVLTGDYTTAAKIYGVLNTMTRGSVATIVTRAAASNAMCGVNYDMYGTIWRNPSSGSDNFYLSMTRTSGIEQYCYVFTLTSSWMSHGTVYKYTGTAV